MLEENMGECLHNLSTEKVFYDPDAINEKINKLDYTEIKVKLHGKNTISTINKYMTGGRKYLQHTSYISAYISDNISNIQRIFRS